MLSRGLELPLRKFSSTWCRHYCLAPGVVLEKDLCYMPHEGGLCRSLDANWTWIFIEYVFHRLT